MANFNTKAEATVTMNGKDAEIVLNTLKESAKKLRTQIIQIQKTDPNNPNLKKMQSELKSLEKSASNVTRSTFDYQKVLKNLNGATLKELQKTKQTLLGQIKNMTRGTEEYIKKSKQLQEVNANINEINDSIKEQEGAMSKVGYAFGKYFGLISTAIAGFTGLSMAMSSVRDAAAKMSDVYADVMKTTGMTADEVKALNEEFKKMDTRTSREELNNLARDAGKLGIAKEDVLGFVEASNQINVALGEDLGDDAIKNIGKLISVFETAQGDLQQMDLKDQMLAVGSAINSLGQSSTASEQYLVDFTQRLGGVASQAGISLQSILGYASALDQSGQAVEMSATALQKFIMNLLGEPVKFAEIAGLEVQKFNDLIATDTNAAIMTVLRALRDKGGFQQLIPIFKEMGMDGARAVGVLSALATNIEAVETAQRISNEEFTKAISLTNEYSIKNDTLQGRIDKARQKIADMREEIGNKLQGALLTGNKLFFGLVKVLVNIPKSAYILIGAIVLLYARILLLNTVTKAWAVIAATGTAVSKAWSAALFLLRGNTVKAAAAWKSLNATMKTNVIVAIAAAIYGLVKGIISLVSSTDRATKAYNEFKKEMIKEKNAINNIFTALKKTNEGTEERQKLIKKINEVYGEYLGYQLDEKANLEEIEKAQRKVTRAVLEDYAEKKKAEAKNEILEDEEYDEKIIKASKKIIDTATEAYKKIYSDEMAAEKAQEYFDAIQEAIDNAKSWDEVGFYDITQNFGLKGGIDNVTKLYQITKKMNNEFAAVDKKFDPIFKKTKKLSEYDIDEIVVTGTIKDKKETDTETEKETEARFKARLAQLEQQQREERNMQTRAYAQGKIDREEYNVQLSAIDFTYLFKRKELYAQFGKDTSEIDTQILNTLAKITDTVYERMKKVNDDFVKFAKQGKDELDKLIKDSDKAAADDMNDYLDQKLDEANKVREELNENNIVAQMQREMDALDELHNMGLLSEEEYQKALMNVRIRTLLKYIKKAQVMLEAGAGLSNAMQDAEVAKVEAAEQQKLQALQQRRDAGLITEEEYNAEKEKIDNEAAQKKLDIEKKYADVNFAIRIAEIIANTAAAAMTAYAQLGPVAGAIAAAMIAATGAVQIAAAKAERDKVKAMTLDASSSEASTQQRVVLPGAEEGGYTEVERAQDGKRFWARRSKKRGYAEAPTVLIGEAGAEFVANADAVRNPTIKPALDLINIAQQNGSVSSINLPKLINSMYAVRGYESGGYTSTPAAAPSPAADANSAETAALMKEVRDLLYYLKTNGVDAWVVLSQLQKQQAMLEKSQKLGSR